MAVTESVEEVRVDTDIPDALNLGSGDDYREGWHNVDIAPSVGPDLKHDLNDTPWPLPADHFVRIEAQHVLEHLEEPLAALRECCRVAASGATIRVVYPLGHTRFEDPTHRWHWNWHTAAALAGDREHDHEVDLPLRLVARNADWEISYADPLTAAYVSLRERLTSAGPWLEQVPGMYGEMSAVYRYEPDGGDHSPAKHWARYDGGHW